MVPLSELLDTYDVRGGATYGKVEGVNILKQFSETVANLTQADLSKYKNVEPHMFAANLMHIGRDVTLPVALNCTNNLKFVSPAYFVFKVKDTSRLIPEFLLILFLTKSFDRRAWFNTDSSVRGNLSWDDLCRVKIPLPPIEVQRTYVNAYKGLTALIEQNDALVKTLEATGLACVSECRKKWPMVKIGDYLRTLIRKNQDGLDLPFMGVNRNKQIVPTAANIESVDRKKYSILKKGEFVYSGMQTGRDICIRIALSDFDHDVLVSPAYTIFEVDLSELLIPEYLFLNFKSSEMDRLGWFKSDSSVRANLDWDRFCEIEIPLPPIEVQRAIVALYRCVEESRKIADEAKMQLTKICPAMVQRASYMN